MISNCFINLADYAVASILAIWRGVPILASLWDADFHASFISVHGLLKLGQTTGVTFSLPILFVEVYKQVIICFDSCIVVKLI